MLSFKNIFDFNNISERIEHDRVMHSLYYISEIEKEMERQSINKAELAKKLCTSKSYLTQLWQGDKVLNMEMIAKIQYVLNIKFKVSTNVTG